MDDEEFLRSISLILNRANMIRIKFKISVSINIAKEDVVDYPFCTGYDTQYSITSPVPSLFILNSEWNRARIGKSTQCIGYNRAGFSFLK